MSRREVVRVVLFVRGTLTGGGRSVRCAITEASGRSAFLTGIERLPQAPLRLAAEFGEETVELSVDVVRVDPNGGVAVSFPPSERLHRLLAAEQRRALAQGRVNISERRRPSSGRERPGAELNRHDQAPPDTDP